MRFKFRTRVRVKIGASSRIITPDGVQTQAEFFEGQEGAVIRHDPEKGGYLVVLDCPEIKNAFGETITAYFKDHELEPLAVVFKDTAGSAPVSLPTPTGLPWEYPDEKAGAPHTK